MKRKPYFPDTISERPEWFHQFATQLLVVNPVLGVDTTTLNARVADALYCEYLSGPWLNWMRDSGKAATEAVKTLYRGESEGAYAPPVLTPPPLPPGDATATPPIPATVPVPAGALLRIFDFVASIKRMATYNTDIGQQLGIIGEENAAEHEWPDYSLELEDGSGSCQCVRINFKKYGHEGVVVWSRRGTGAWEKLDKDTRTPFIDQRQLLNASQPEAREYRLQFFDDDVTGNFSAVQTITVRPL